jgi:hypothetical protein
MGQVKLREKSEFQRAAAAPDRPQHRWGTFLQAMRGTHVPVCRAASARLDNLVLVRQS